MFGSPAHHHFQDPEMIRILPLFIAGVLAATAVADSNRISFHEKSDSELEVRIGDRVLTVFNHGSNWNKPFLYPLHAPDGRNVLRDIIPTKAEQGSSKDGTDHFHHKGVWVSVDSVNEERLNFWHEGSKIENTGIVHKVREDGVGHLLITNSWLEDDKPLLKETTSVLIYPSNLITYHIELTAVSKDVTIYDTKEGFFAVRVAHTMREMQGGSIVNADGLKGEKECWGKPTPWIDYYGEVDGATCGVTLMDHPANFRASRYHVRGYGLFAISPFGPKKYSGGKEPEAPVTISPGGKSFTVTYGLYVHNGDTDAGKVAEAYEQFLKVTK